jgi:hypothetical protein
MMKKLLITCILVLSLFGLTSAATLSGVSAIGCKVGPIFGPELVTNGGMEVGDPPSNYDQANYPTTNERSGTQKYTGSYSYHIADALNARGFGQFDVSTPVGLALVSGKTYLLMFQYFLVSGGVRCTISTGGDVLYYTYSTTGSWVSVSISFTSGSGSPKGVAFSTVDAAEFYIDDMSIRELQ